MGRRRTIGRRSLRGRGSGRNRRDDRPARSDRGPPGPAQPTKTAPAGRAAGIDGERLVRIVALVLSGLLVVAIAARSSRSSTNLERLAFPIDGDRVLYMDATRSWLNGTGFYHDYQLAGPTRSARVTSSIRRRCSWSSPRSPRSRSPSPPRSTTRSRSGSRSAPSSGCDRRSSAGRRSCSASGGRRRSSSSPAATGDLDHGVHGARDPLAAASVLVFLKPTLAPFAFFGANRRSWWVALGALGLVSLLFLPMWLDYLAASGTPTAAAGSSTRSVRRRCCSCRSRPGRRRAGGSRRGHAGLAAVPPAAPA